MWHFRFNAPTEDATATASPVGLGLRSRQMLCPSSPTLRQLRDSKQARHLMAIMRVDAEDISDGEVMIGLLDDPDLVSRAHIALEDDSEIGTRPHRLGEAAWKHFIVHPHSEPPTRDPRLG